MAEAQIDRFMVKYNVLYPDKAEETELMIRKNHNFEEIKADIKCITPIEQILDIQRLIHETVRVSSSVINYMINVCTVTRPPETYSAGKPDMDIYQYIRLGSSPRATESLLALSKSYAFCHGRDFVNFDDVNRCAPHVLRHRILLNSLAISKQISTDMIIEEVLGAVNPY